MTVTLLVNGSEMNFSGGVDLTAACRDEGTAQSPAFVMDVEKILH